MGLLPSWCVVMIVPTGRRVRTRRARIADKTRRRYPVRPSMPKMKSHSSAKKRFKVTGSGKLKARHAFSSHKLEHKSAKYKRKLDEPVTISKADRKTVTRLLGGSGR
jgi:large subunit ribosomal protein L35